MCGPHQNTWRRALLEVQIRMAERKAAYAATGHQHRFASIDHIVLARSGRSELLQRLRLDAERHLARRQPPLDAQAAYVVVCRSRADGAVVDFCSKAHAE